MADVGGNDCAKVSLKDQGNTFFKSGNYLKAAALYTQAIKLDPENSTLYSNRAAAFTHLVKLSKALSDAEKTISLNPQWEKGYFRKGCVLEAMERFDDAIATFQIALQHNTKNVEVSRKIKKLTSLAADKKRVLELDNIRSNVDMGKYLYPLKTELSEKFKNDESDEMFSFIVNVIEKAIKVWHETGKVDPRVNFLLNKPKTDTEKYAPIVNIDKAFESPDTHKDCFSYLRKYADDSFSRAACLVAPKKIISYPQVWKGQGSRRWKHGCSDGFFIQFEATGLRKLWFVPSSTEKGRTLCSDPDSLDIDAHEVLPRIFKE
ncbi:Stress-induced protein 1 [Zostera marina]|uniref:Stress-induced protein 1 n=1 Tax=Zostera marina TaxID=29655 RepID=A0A0K9NH57_ZOSMR|nr:Stress-induced protein 1 [Zostera marina]